MERAATYLIACLAPAAAFWGLSRGLRWLQEADRMPWERRPDPRPPRRPIEQLAADLRRLSVDRELARVSSLPAKRLRMNASDLAYDDVLVCCCAALELPLPGTPPLSESQRMATEASLREAGLRW